MTTTTTVSQEAREAAAKYGRAVGILTRLECRAMRSGENDDCTLVQAFHNFEQSIRQQAERAFDERERKLREAGQFLLWIYDSKGPVLDSREAWEQMRQALKETPDAQ